MRALTEQENQKLNAGRLMKAESGLLLPLLQTKQTLVIAKIVSAFREGKHEQLIGLAAELSTLAEMKHEITRTIKTAETLEEIMYEPNEPSER